MDGGSVGGPIRFFYDVVCPYAYMASARVEDLATATGREVLWRPVLLGGVLRQVGAASDPSSERSHARQRVDRRDIERQGAHVGLPIRRPDAHPRRTVSAMRVLVGVDSALVPELSRAFFRAYWEQGLDVAQEEVLQELARPFGVDARALVASDHARSRLYAATNEAVDAGAFGVPSFEVDGTVWWGVDRLGLLVASLGGGPWSVGRVEPSAPEAAAGSARTVTFFHDFASPFSYLAALQIEAVAARTRARVEWVPITLGGLFRAIGTPDVPLFAMNPVRQRYFIRDVHDWAEALGVRFAFPQTFPQRTIDALRMALVDPGLTLPLYRAVWSEGRDLGHPGVLAEVVGAAGRDPGALLQASQAPEIKAQLRANTERAAAAGACGVPSFLVDGELVWGQDRLDVVERLLLGWRPPEPR